ncbi:DUF3089 domain-containing protein [Nocardia sp. SYP-A9097]|uniref:DUF3089 domain-containing protein n=1 Tax=Nocardia sp. SYP-A9097 TaxID=2663237 RepID=UPI00129B82D9|nr:DUF3089 domain-containing protein [Nocardia sp. SYP-A9097]MRH87724.1 DUF3089 domain-containing protein [Nocardia sp. SYP-A9097]
MIRFPAVAALLGSTVLALIAAFTVAAPAASAEETTTWLCRPGQAADPCGGRSGAPIDCFYVYPTVSLQQTANSNFDASPELRAVAGTQAGPFGAQCNVWAPVYRQVTLGAMFDPPDEGLSAARDFAYEDVENAWNDYLANHNDGRGVVLIGHSQGTRLLRSLIRDHIDGKPAQAQLVSALLIGGDVLVPKGATVGGDFASVPACTDPEQIGCVIAYSSFTRTPPSNTRFGRSPQTPDVSAVRGTLPFGPGYEVLCTNPAALRDNADAPIHPMVEGREFDGLQAHCTGDDDTHVLLVSGPAAALLPVLPDQTWGTHLLDVNLAQQDLVNLVATQSATYQRR